MSSVQSRIAATRSFSRWGAAWRLTPLSDTPTCFGFGLLAPTDIREQTSGLIPDSAYLNTTHVQWGQGTVMNLGIGQGDMGVTPLQLARYIAAIGNAGTCTSLTWYPTCPTRSSATPCALRPNRPAFPLTRRIFLWFCHGLRLVMENGSGRLAKYPGIPSGGKTGTAEASGGMEDHSVFVMFAP